MVRYWWLVEMGPIITFSRPQSSMTLRQASLPLRGAWALPATIMLLFCSIMEKQWFSADIMELTVFSAARNFITLPPEHSRLPDRWGLHAKSLPRQHYQM